MDSFIITKVCFEKQLIPQVNFLLNDALLSSIFLEETIINRMIKLHFQMNFIIIVITNFNSIFCVNLHPHYYHQLNLQYDLAHYYK